METSMALGLVVRLVSHPLQRFKTTLTVHLGACGNPDHELCCTAAVVSSLPTLFNR